jgi:hypothetical protein
MRISLAKSETRKSAKVPGDRLVLALISAFRTLVLELSKRGVLDAEDFATMLQQTAVAHREAGDPNNLADAIHALSEHLQISNVNDRGQKQ